MSEAIVSNVVPSTPVEQEQQAPAPVPAEQTPAEPNEEQQLKEAEKIRKECSRSYRAGEREYRKGLLEAGRLAHSYLCIRMGLGHSREAAVKTLEGDLSAFSSRPVDVGRLIRCYSAWHLLCEVQGLVRDAGDVPYGAYVDGWSTLTERHNPGKATESYVLIPGMETEALALFADSIKAGWVAKDVADKCGALRLRAAQLAEEKAAAQRVEKEKAEQAAREEASKAAQEKASKEQEAKRLSEEARKASDQEEAKRLTEAAEKAKSELLAAQKAEQEALSRADQERKAKEQQQKREIEARQAKERETAKQQRAADRAAGKSKKDKPEPTSLTVAPDCNQGHNLLDTLAKSAKANSKDTAIMFAGILLGMEDPLAATHDLIRNLADRADTEKECKIGCDDVLDSCLLALEDHKGLSAKARRAIKAALLVLRKKDSPSPAEIAGATSPAGNGQLVTAAS